MGIKSLMTWVKANHPEVIKFHRSRFAAKGIRGKRLALDGTLLTNRFHFAAHDLDNSIRSTLIGWYNMVQEMKRNGIQPVAIWDERGERPWKAPEARRRLEARSIILARSMHEDRRAARIDALRSDLKVFGALSDPERAVVREAWRREFAPFDDKSAAAIDSNDSPISDFATLPPLAVLVIVVTARLNTLIGRLAGLYSEYTIDSEPQERARRDGGETLFAAFEREEENINDMVTSDEAGIQEIVADDPALAVDADTARVHPVDDPSTTSAGLTLLAPSSLWLSETDGTRLLDARLASLAPATVYTETPRQAALTDVEGQIWASFGEDSALPEMLKLIDEILTIAPAVRHTYARYLSPPLEAHHTAARALCVRMGVPVLIARVPFEAEGVGASLWHAGLVDFVATEDSDVVAYGAPLLRNITNSRQPIVTVNSPSLLESTPMTNDQFIDFCILLGTDASPRIPGVGPATATTLLTKYGTIEAILAAEPQWAARISELCNVRDQDEFMDMVRNARSLFKDLPPIPEGLELKQRPWDDDKLAQWLIQKYGVRPPGCRDLDKDIEEQEDWGSVRPLETRSGDVWDESWGTTSVPQGHGPA